jgi:hypothetical protein
MVAERHMWKRVAISPALTLAAAAALCGPAAATLSLLLVALSPTLIAHGRLVAADFACSAGMLFASYRPWRFDQRPTRGAAICLLLPALTLRAAATFDPVSSGVRRVLPVLPVLAVAAGSWTTVGRSSLRTAGLSLLVALHAASALRTWPHCIPYFNEAALAFGNPEDYLDDCDVDWGQDLKALPAVMRERGIPQVHLFYFGTADPDYYGIAHRRAQGNELWDPMPGVYSVSLHRLIRARQLDAPPCSGAEPFAKAGTSIWLFRSERAEAAP